MVTVGLLPTRLIPASESSSDSEAEGHPNTATEQGADYAVQDFDLVENEENGKDATREFQSAPGPPRPAFARDVPCPTCRPCGSDREVGEALWRLLPVAVNQAVASTVPGGAWRQPLQREAGEGSPLDSIVHLAVEYVVFAMQAPLLDDGRPRRGDNGEMASFCSGCPERYSL
ncbi:hypothetical protein AK812_SmicGene7920 [Symbiodinium microadriaticum]|uniref:Uncharacterized protein n=1 Tax=Symbiodinium microadriaticum TaxID=2951 RepID=A0A1Q9EMA6_SYMMI|nr:hypothetical protein AK812_SmicGene7920 [Symbiodinium microadriaticum]